MRQGKGLRAKRTDTAAAEAAQRKAAIERDGIRCKFQRLSNGLWSRCLSGATETCHIYRRNECGKAIDHVDVVVRGCEHCHDLFDLRVLGKAVETARATVRVAPEDEERAYRRILEMSKSPPPRRYPNGARI